MDCTVRLGQSAINPRVMVAVCDRCGFLAANAGRAPDGQTLQAARVHAGIRRVVVGRVEDAG